MKSNYWMVFGVGLFFGCFPASAALVHPEPDFTEAQAVVERLLPATRMMAGLSYVATAHCDPKSGEITYAGFEGPETACVIISTISDDAYRAMQLLFPNHRKVGNIFVNVVRSHIDD